MKKLCLGYRGLVGGFLSLLLWALDRLNEPSSWAGLSAVMVSLNLTGASSAHVAGVLAAVCGAVAVVLKEAGVVEAKLPPPVV